MKNGAFDFMTLLIHEKGSPLNHSRLVVSANNFAFGSGMSAKTLFAGAIDQTMTSQLSKATVRPVLLLKSGDELNSKCCLKMSFHDTKVIGRENEFIVCSFL